MSDFSQKSPPPHNILNVVEAIQARRSVRVFKSTVEVPEEVMRSCLDLALLAPTSANLQCWEFYWMKSNDKKEQLVEACLNQPAARTAKELVVAIARTDTWKTYTKMMLDQMESLALPPPKVALDYYRKIVPFIYTQGFLNSCGWLKKIIFTIRGLWTPTPREPTTQAEMITWAVKTTSLACENFMLAVEGYGFQSCCMEGFDSVRVKKILKLPRGAHVVMVIAVGQQAPGGVYGPRIRFDRDLFIKEV
jgi:nitroreductase